MPGPADPSQITAQRAAGQRRRARLAITSIFLLVGVAIGTWVSRVPAIKDQAHLTNAQLGVALFMIACGALVAMPVAGWATSRIGSRLTARVSLVAFVLAFAVPALAHTLAALMVALALFGAAYGALDVSMNTQGMTVERVRGSPILSSLHAAFSIGGLFGAAIGGLAASSGLPPLPHFALVTAAVGLPVVMMSGGLIGADDSDGRGPTFARPSRDLAALALVAFCTLLGEGAAADWSAAYMTSSLGTAAGIAALPYAAYSIGMAGGRLYGDRLFRRWGPVRVLRVAGAFACGGLTAGLLVARPWAGILAFAALGTGLSCVFPIIIRAASQHRGLATGSSIAAVGGCGRLGFLVGPPLIGITSQATGLPLALGLISVATLLVASLARSAEPTRGRTRIRAAEVSA